MKIKPNLAVNETGFLFNPSTGDSFSLNPTGQEILTLFKQGKSDEEVIEHMTQEYMIDKNTVEKDLYDFKIMLSNYKLGEEQN